jgi:hypothetical protein
VRRVGVALAVLVALLPLGTRPSWADCRCATPETPAAEVDHAALLFTGRVVSITTPLGEAAAVEFHVETLYKGTAERTVTVTTAVAGGLCHFDFRPGVRYTVFADDHRSTTACSGNVRGIINAKGYGVSPIPLSQARDPTGGVARWVWAVVAVALALALALMAGTRRRATRSAGPRSGPPPARPAPAP